MVKLRDMGANSFLNTGYVPSTIQYTLHFRSALQACEVGIIAPFYRSGK